MFQFFEECKNIMLHRGKVFMKKLMTARGKIAKLASSFIADGSVSTNTISIHHIRCFSLKRVKFAENISSFKIQSSLRSNANCCLIT